MICHAPLDPPNLKLYFSWLLHAAGANFLHLSLANGLCTGALYMDVFSMPNTAVAEMLPCACGIGSVLTLLWGWAYGKTTTAPTVQVSEVLGLIPTAVGLKSH